jgi:asparagine N-glycosylation enzyme membrane subunit Stt3
MEDALEKRQGNVVNYLKSKPLLLVYGVLALIGAFGFYVRTRNLPLLIDATTGKYIPIALDPFVFLRYVKYLVANGSMMAVDTLRYYPLGFTGLEEFTIVTYVIAYFYKILSVFNSAVTIEYAHVIYPAVAFVIGLVVFYFLLTKIFNWKVGIVGSAFLTVLPAYLYRTMAGFSDKEAFAMILMFLGMLFFINYLHAKKDTHGFIYAGLAGFTLGTLYLVWGGAGFLQLTIGAFMVTLVLLRRVSKKSLLQYTLFFVLFALTFRFGYPARASWFVFVQTPYLALMLLAVVFGWLDYLLFKSKLLKVKRILPKIPEVFVSLGALIAVIFVGVSLYFGPSFFLEQAQEILRLLTAPQTSSRWTLTVAESHQPYFVDLLGNFGWWFLGIVYLGCIALFYETFKSFGKKAIYLTQAFAIFIIAFSMTRYSSGSQVFNGVTATSINVYIGSLIVFTLLCLYMLYTKYKEENFAIDLRKINLNYLFVLFFFFFTLMGARSAIRLLFTFAPATAIVGAFGIVYLGNYAYQNIKEKNLRQGAVLVVAALAIFLLYGFSQTVLEQASYTGASYNAQWQNAMNWVRNGTPDDAVFAHWWDYGYWVQSMGERATLSDGGNARGSINHYIGRYLLTGQSETEALQLLAANNATHVLMISDEIQKYGAFSSIGADENYDRYSYIPTFGLDMSQTHEGRNATNLVYTGGFVLDEDINFQGTLIPAGGGYVAGLAVPTVFAEDGITPLGFQQPTAAVIFNNQQFDIPMDCVFFAGQEFKFGPVEGVESMNSCAMIIPYYSQSQVTELGGMLYLSERVYPTVFTHLYLFQEDWDYFELVYTDYPSYPLMIYEGRIIGPLKIWEVSYPEDLEIPKEYYDGTPLSAEIRGV